MFFVITGNTAQSFETFDEAAHVFVEMVLDGSPVIVAQRVEMVITAQPKKKTRKPYGGAKNKAKRAERDKMLQDGVSPTVVAAELDLPLYSTQQAAYRLNVKPHATQCPECGVSADQFKNYAGFVGHVWAKHGVRLSEIEREVK